MHVLIVRTLNVIVHGTSYDVCIVWVFMRDFYTLVRVLSVCKCIVELVKESVYFLN